MEKRDFVAERQDGDHVWKTIWWNNRRLICRNVQVLWKKSLITLYQSKDVVKDYVRQYTKLKFLHAVAWPLYDELDDIPGNVTRGVADAFVDLIWELAGKE